MREMPSYDFNREGSKVKMVKQIMFTTAEILTIGDELNRGEIIDTNSSWLAERLTSLGVYVRWRTSVTDQPDDMTAALQQASARAGLVVCSGGLGPTDDDRTVDVVSALLAVAPTTEPAHADKMRARFAARGFELTPNNLRQVRVPTGAAVMPNEPGLAPGFGVKMGATELYFMPGVPREMKRMFEEQVTSRIRALASNDRYQIRVRTFGLPESAVGEKLAGVESSFPGTIIGYRANYPEIEVKVLVRAASSAAARDVCERATAEVRARLGTFVYGDADDTFAGVVGRALRARGWKLAIAESCTGGLVGHMLTREPGASDFLVLDAVTYANSSKSRILGVDEETIRWHGAVSPEVATAMAAGAKRVSGSDVALSLTGIAGPSGGTDEKPVGTVYFALARPDGAVDVKHRLLVGDRAQIQTLASYAGLQMVRELCASRVVDRPSEATRPAEHG